MATKENEIVYSDYLTVNDGERTYQVATKLIIEKLEKRISDLEKGVEVEDSDDDWLHGCRVAF